MTMISITASFDRALHGSIGAAVDAAVARTEAQRRAIELAKVKTMTFVAKDAQADLKEEILRVFNNPTRMTQNSAKVLPATMSKQRARVFIHDDEARYTLAQLRGLPTPPGGTTGIRPSKYLMPQVEGGNRRHKRFEKALQARGKLPQGWYTAPARGAKLNKYGNITGGQYQKMLSHVGGSRDIAQDITGSARSRRNRRSGVFFIMRSSRGPIGIFKRSGRRLEKWVNFFPGTPSYSAKFHFKSIVERHSIQRAPSIFRRVLAREMSRL